MVGGQKRHNVHSHSPSLSCERTMAPVHGTGLDGEMCTF